MNAAPAPSSPHVMVNAVAMLVLTVGHVLSIGSVIINVLGLALDLPFFPAAKSEPELLGNMIAFTWMGVVALVGSGWAPVNAYGLFKRRPWALKSTQAYWVFLGVLCCCLPGSAYGIWSLRRADVRREFEDSNPQP